MPRGDGKYKTCPRIRVNGKKKRVSHIVMEKNINRSIRDDEVVHHKNTNTQDNCLSNLELMTKSAHAKHHNPRDTLKYGVSAAEDKVTWSKRYRRHVAEQKGIPPRVFQINQKIYDEIKRLLKETSLTQYQIADRFNIRQYTVSRIHTNSRYQQFEKEVN